MVTHSKQWERQRAVKSFKSKLKSYQQQRSLPTEPEGISLKTLAIGAGIVILLTVVLGMAIRKPKDYRALFDEQVETRWITGRELVDAAEFFASGGVFENRNDDDAIEIDQKYVVPLIEQLKLHHSINFQAARDPANPMLAYSLIAKVPDQRTERNAIRTKILAVADEFPGLVYQKWGHQWLSLDFFDDFETTPMKKSGVLRKLKASQRRME